jgi:hypothetical protein
VATLELLALYCADLLLLGRTRTEFSKTGLPGSGDRMTITGIPAVITHYHIIVAQWSTLNPENLKLTQF